MNFTDYDGVIRAFPRRTNATPIDDLAFIGAPSKEFLKSLDKQNDNKALELAKTRREVLISVVFTYDIKKAEQMAVDWQKAGFSAKIGGTAFNHVGGEFVSGLFLKNGFVITSRGCDRGCWFCSVPKREGSLRELEIKDGFNILDDNLLACSETHTRGGSSPPDTHQMGADAKRLLGESPPNNLHRFEPIGETVSTLPRNRGTSGESISCTTKILLMLSEAAQNCKPIMPTATILQNMIYLLKTITAVCWGLYCQFVQLKRCTKT